MDFLSHIGPSSLCPFFPILFLGIICKQIICNSNIPNKILIFSMRMFLPLYELHKQEMRIVAENSCAHINFLVDSIDEKKVFEYFITLICWKCCKCGKLLP